MEKKIREEFPDYELENPKKEEHQRGYKKYKEEHGSGMKYFFDEVLPNIDIGVFLPFKDGKWGAGVFKEARFLYNNDKPVYRMSYTGELEEIDIEDLEDDVLSVEETRGRVH
ncbi:MAG: hypothetical protein SVV03_06320 [Candidatus Nanohaloarchaea archaeon]|nr:hypothetical protein [Candidatus Nanohaloarchaea archaeon]